MFKAANIQHVSYVPDGGHRGLIDLCTDDPQIGTTVLTTEEEGVGLAAGLFLGGQRSVLLMQSSGVGNCLNLFTLAENCRLPLVLLVTMRGEFAEFVPWQIPMGKRAGAALELMGFDVFRAEDPATVGDICSGAIDQAFYSSRSTAVLLSQRLIGRKNWSK
ncbi:MAG TPA: thiamine pyrophosphate-binding protein [Bradyrhizobium sp.]|nr:thiamine pyrophosphate-binding protein [Bradyrhizobium sp.]